MSLPRDFRELLEEFVRDGVEHVVIGGYAFAFHAEPRATKDLDVLLSGDDANLERAARSLARYGAPTNVVDAVRSLGPNDVAYFGLPPLRIDLLRSIDGVETAEVFRNAVRAEWDGMPVKVIGLDDLIANKRAARRPQDIADATKLERVRHAQRRPT
jgi:predicted nucleotidyltransferase